MFPVPGSPHLQILTPSPSNPIDFWPCPSPPREASPSMPALHPPKNHCCVGVGDISEKLSIADISAFLKLIGKLSLSKKIDLGIIEKLSLSKMCSWFRSDKYCSIYPSRRHNLPPTLEIIIKFSKIFQSQHREFQNLWEVHRQSQVQNLLRQT